MTAMASDADRQKILAGISDKQVLDLEQAAIRIPSTTFVVRLVYPIVGVAAPARAKAL